MTPQSTEMGAMEDEDLEVFSDLLTDDVEIDGVVYPIYNGDYVNGQSTDNG